MYDVLGNEVSTVSIYLKGKELINLDVSSLQGGIYFIQVKTEEHFYTKKIIIEN